jgi:branched-chain amino acid aminotransferase
MFFVCFSGTFLPSSQPVLQAGNRGYKWGDGIFETIKVYKGNILFSELHFERMEFSLRLLEMNSGAETGREELSEKILELCTRNRCISSARVRLSIFRTEEQNPGYLIEAFPLPSWFNSWQEKGQHVDLYPWSRKSCDAFSNLKTANFLPYVMASRFAQQKGMDDALVLNAENHLADSSRANIFLVKDKVIFTPALHQGCINGVIRRWIIDQVKLLGYELHQTALTDTDLLEADELFLSNSIQDIRWVSRFREKTFHHTHTKILYNQLFSTIYI